MNATHGPMYAKSVKDGKFEPDTPARRRVGDILDSIPAQNRNVEESRLREFMREASKTSRTIHYLDDGERASVITNVTKRFAPHYRDSISAKKLGQVEEQIREIGVENMITGCIRVGNNSDGYEMNFEIAVPKDRADLLLTSGISFFPMKEGQKPDGFMIILPDSKEQTVNISKSDCVAVVEGTDYPGNAGKKTIMTIAGWVASQVGLIMEHFGLGRVTIRGEDGRFRNINVKIGGASFTGKTTTLTGFVDERVFLPGESRVCYNDDMIFTDPRTGKSYSMESGNFFTCIGLTPESDKYLWQAQKNPKTIGYNLVVRDGEFDYQDKKSDPNARIAVPRGAHRAIDIDRYNTTDTAESSGRIDFSMQLFRGPHFPPGFVIKDPEIAAILLAAGPTQQTAAVKGGGGTIKVKGYYEFRPIVDEGKFEARLADKENPMPHIEQMFDPAAVRELLKSGSNSPVAVSKLINELYVSGFIMEDAASYMSKLLALYSEFPIVNLGLNTGYVGPIIANAVVHPFDGPTVRVHDFSVALTPVISQYLWVHTMRGEIKTAYDPLLGVDVITQAGGVDLTPILPRTLYKKAGLDYEDTVRKAYSRYADFLEANGLSREAGKLRGLSQGNGKT